MSTIVSALVWKHSGARGAALLVLLSLADQANDDGWCWPSVASVAARCRVSDRSVQRSLIELERSGELVREERRGHSTRYQVTLGVTIAVTPDTVSPLTSDVTPDKLSLVTGDDGGGVTVAVGGGVTTVSPRNINESSMNRNGAKTSRARQLPDKWQPTDNHLTYARQHRLDLPHEIEQFTNHHRSKASKFVDWDAAFRTWLGNAVKWGRSQPALASQDGRPEGW